MVVNTRAQIKKYKQESRVQEAPCRRSGRHVRICATTSSFVDASVRTYKIYTGGCRGGGGSGKGATAAATPAVDAAVDAAVDVAVDALADMATLDEKGSQHRCINPMNPISRYIYKIEVFNKEHTYHYKTAFVLYNNANRMYYVYSISSNQFQPNTPPPPEQHLDSFPVPRNTIQLEYTSYTHDSIVNYIMTLLVPLNLYDYFIRDDIIGAVSSNPTEFTEMAFSEHSSYYDIDRFIYDDQSRSGETFNAFQLIPSRNYWFDPFDAQPSHPYTSDIPYSVLTILSSHS